MFRVPLLIISLACLLPAHAGAQEEPDTRAEEAREAREAKSASLSPPRPGRLERALLALENGRLFERILNPAEGFYPKMGNVTTGGGFAVGPGYRRPGLFGERVDISAFAMGSMKQYWLADARVTLPRLADGRLFAEAFARASDYTQEEFFGLGPASDRSDASFYALRNTEIGASGAVRPFPWLSLGTTVSRVTPDARSADHQRSIDRFFDTSALPGFDIDTHFIRTRAFADLNYREPRLNPRTGGRYLLSVDHYNDTLDGRYAFNRYEADLQQYISFLKNRRVIALHGLVSVGDPHTGADIPFFLQRTLGGPDDLRGFRRFRFRDRHALLLQAEYRWEIFTAVDGAIFYDAGKVASSTRDLDLSDLESDYGIGFRFGTINGVFLRIEGAFGSSGGKHFIFRFGHVF